MRAERALPGQEVSSVPPAEAARAADAASAPLPLEVEPESSHPRCPACGGVIDPLRTRHIAVLHSKVISFCSPDCRERGAAPRVAEPILPPPQASRRSRLWPIFAAASVVVAAAGVLLGVRVRVDTRTATAALPSKVAAPAPAPPDPFPMYGPEPPPADFFIEGDRWVHPLAGPVRRLPERPTRRFGVGRDHDSPESCRQGHCGVDIGEVKGEPVLAVHDGVIERVQREDNAHGGKYVRLLHKGGSVITQYFHLDTIPDALRPGYHVRAGEVVGTLGDSGVLQSGPHLHFTVATRAKEDAPEIYIDPEPLLTLWPLTQH